MKLVYTADDPIQAHVIKNFLQARGIPAVVAGDELFWVRGPGASMSNDSLPQVWVTNDEDALRALGLIAEGAPLGKGANDGDADST